MNLKTITQYSLGPVGSALLGFVTLPMITWHFSPDDVGRLSMLFIAQSFIMILFSLGLDQSYIRYYYSSKNVGQLFKDCITPGLTLFITISLILYIFDPTLLSFILFGIQDSTLTSLTLVCILVTYLQRFLSLIIRMQENAFLFSLSQFLPKVFFLIYFLLIISFEGASGFLYLLLGQLVSNLLMFLYLLYENKEEIYKAISTKFSLKDFSEYFVYGLPLSIGALAYWGLTAADKFFLRAYSSLNELGVYSVAISFATAAIIFQKVFTTIWTPYVYKTINDRYDDSEIRNINKYVVLFVVVIMSLLGGGSWLIDYVLPSEYTSVKYLVLPCMLAPLFYVLSETTVVGLNIVKKTNYSMLASIFAFIMNVVGNYFLVKMYGAYGAAISTAVSFWIFLVLRTELSCYFWKSIPRTRLYILTLLLLIASIVTVIVTSLFIILIWSALLLFVMIFFYKDFLTVFSLIKNNNHKRKGD
ncbi:lipopolysaccharide biosynthesis protein [Pseudoalteromonas sp. Angola-7]|uniref:lipopolysaccharide biosynthesis protein n=1 Tax=Pseudoalteromonas sp. Angola-7 TaxID=3025336 RepID=UPI002359A7DE|nr:oligosaccharide flippase family protein [Pseudoalteromonas sp. Angola-7]MDC9529676.1 oligosaccharide flippase family protein [Pseudoalteromonas sp. Angola-7]